MSEFVTNIYPTPMESNANRPMHFGLPFRHQVVY